MQGIFWTVRLLELIWRGRLRKGGYVEMVQLNNSTNTFLFDIFLLTKNKD
jgi:hypothetical protein